MIKITALPVFAVFGCLAFSVPALADIDLYNNGPINGTIDAWGIDFGFAVSDSFTISNASTVTGVTYGEWINAGETPFTVQWAIGSSEGGSDLGSGTANVSSAVFGSRGTAYTLYSSSFSVPSISLAAGTYWLTLSNASPATQYWDVTNGLSTAFDNGFPLAGSEGPDSTGSESFTITGEAGTVAPEPGFQIVGAGLFACIGAGAFLRRRKIAHQSKA